MYRHMMVGIPRIDRPTPDQVRALTTWGFLDPEGFRPAWSLPGGWSIKTLTEDYGGYGQYSDIKYGVTDPGGQLRFFVTESHNPAGTRRTLEMVAPPSYRYVRARRCVKTDALIEQSVFESLADFDCAVDDAYFDEHDVHRELEHGLTTMVEIKRQHQSATNW